MIDLPGNSEIWQIYASQLSVISLVVMDTYDLACALQNVVRINNVLRFGLVH